MRLPRERLAAVRLNSASPMLLCVSNGGGGGGCRRRWCKAQRRREARRSQSRRLHLSQLTSGTTCQLSGSRAPTSAVEVSPGCAALHPVPTFETRWLCCCPSKGVCVLQLPHITLSLPQTLSVCTRLCYILLYTICLVYKERELRSSMQSMPPVSTQSFWAVASSPPATQSTVNEWPARAKAFARTT